MGFIKIQAKQLFDGYRLLNNQVLILQDNGVVEGIVAATDAGDDVQYKEGILTPGFINCHCHLELSHLKGHLQQHTGLPGFLLQVIQKRRFADGEILQSIADAEDAMRQNGIVAVGDISNTTHTLFQKQKNNLYYHNFIEAIGSNPNAAEANFNFYHKVYKAFADSFGIDNVSMVPHTPYTVSAALWEKITHLPHNKLLSLHNQESQDENLWYQNKTGNFNSFFKALQIEVTHFQATGTSSLQACLPKFLPEQQIILVHNVCTNEADIQFAKNFSDHIFWCLCPNANQYIQGILPPAELFMQQNCNIVLGTDSLASNHQLSIWEEIKALQKAFPQIPVETMLQWATINGAKALCIDSRFGSFEKGKQPGYVIVNE